MLRETSKGRKGISQKGVGDYIGKKEKGEMGARLTPPSSTDSRRANDIHEAYKSNLKKKKKS